MTASVRLAATAAVDTAFAALAAAQAAVAPAAAQETACAAFAVVFYIPCSAIVETVFDCS